METIATYAATTAIVKKHHLTIQKKWGQNFLIDPHVLQKIVAAAEIGPEDFVIEIGPGLGGLTQALAQKAKHVTALEIDPHLIPILEENLGEYSNVTILNGDALKADLNEILRAQGAASAKLVANLPYYITTPILMNLLEKKYPLTSITVMMQKEVAARLTARPGTKDYGAITLGVGYFAESYLAANVPRNCFHPRPNVDSAVVRLTLRQTPAVTVSEEGLLFGMIKAAFAQRRKTLVNAIISWLGQSERAKGRIAKEELPSMKETVTEIVKVCGFRENVRGEALSLEEFATLAEVFHLLRQKSKGLE